MLTSLIRAITRTSVPEFLNAPHGPVGPVHDSAEIVEELARTHYRRAKAAGWPNLCNLQGIMSRIASREEDSVRHVVYIGKDRQLYYHLLPIATVNSVDWGNPPTPSGKDGRSWRALVPQRIKPREASPEFLERVIIPMLTPAAIEAAP